MTVPSDESYVATSRTSAVPWYRDRYVIGKATYELDPFTGLPDYEAPKSLPYVLRVLPEQIFVPPSEVAAYGVLARRCALKITLSWMEVVYSEIYGFEVPVQKHATGMYPVFVTNDYLHLSPPVDDGVGILRVPTDVVTAIRLDDIGSATPVNDLDDWS
jgi:hypothetical protein